MLSLLLILVVMVITVYLSLTYENTGLMLLAYMEAALLLLSVVGLLIRRFTLKAHIEIPVGISEKGSEVPVKITLSNKGLFSLARSKVRVTVYDTLRRKKEWLWFKLPVAARGENVFIRNMRFARIGSYELIVKKLRVYDMTGLVHMDMRSTSVGKIRILPRLNEVSVRLSERTKNFYGESDIYDDENPGHDNSELFGVREYRAGDRLQNVHWKLSVKQDDIMVKEHALPKACPVVLFLEYNPGRKDLQQHTMIPYMEAAVSISFSLMNAGCPHYVVWYDNTEADVKRLRVDDEESLFIFIDTLMKVNWVSFKENMYWRYQEKYRREPYVHALYLGTDFSLKKNEEVLTKLSRNTIEKSLQQIELLI